MEKWSIDFTFQNEPDSGHITCFSFSIGGQYLAAGTSTGEILLFHHTNNWSHVSKIVGTSLSIDQRICDVTRSPLYDLDFIPVKRNCPLLLSLGRQEVRILSVSNHEVPIVSDDFLPTGTEFPIFTQTRPLFSINEVTRCNPRIGCDFSSVKCSPNGIDFSCTESTFIVTRRIERMNPSLQVYTSEDAGLTRLDYSPTDGDVLLVGDEVGFGNIIDTRIQPHQSVPSRRTMPPKVLANKPRDVLDCRFSPDGGRFFTRHFGQLMFWDLRNTSVCLASVPISQERDAAAAAAEASAFRSAWLAREAVATGSYGGAVHIAALRAGALRAATRYATETTEKPRMGLMALARKRGHAAPAVHAVEAREGRVAVANGGRVLVYTRGGAA